MIKYHKMLIDVTQETENPNPVFSACGWLNGMLSDMNVGKGLVSRET